MDFDLFFSSSRWRILEVIAEKPSSPVEISEKIGTSVAYVSQQLKLLEAGGIVAKKRTSSVEKGKPRTVYSLSYETAQMNVLMNGLSFRKAVSLTEHHKIIMKIWILEDTNFHYFLEKLYWAMENNLKDLNAFFVYLDSKNPRVLIVSDSAKLRQKVNSFLREVGDKFECVFVSESDLKKFSDKNIHVIYDPKSILLGKELKGGNE